MATGPVPTVAVQMPVVRRRLAAFPLTAREKEIVYLLFQGCANKEIAGRCNIAVQTVKDHLKHIYQKTGVHQRMALLARLLGTGQL